MFCWFLCRFQFKKRNSCAVSGNLGKKLLYVVCKSQQKELSSDVVFAPAQESSEAMILFQHSEYAFSLYASVHSELSSEFGRYIFLAFCSQFFELMRYRQRLVSFCLCTVLFVGTTFAAFTSVQCFLRNESGLRFLMLCTDTPYYPSSFSRAF